MDVAKTEEDLIGDDADLVDGEVLGKRGNGEGNVLSVDGDFEVEGVERRNHVEHDGAVFLGKRGMKGARCCECRRRRDSNRNRRCPGLGGTC